ncbi:PucR family transcriptional regulator [Bacillus benzoevorans]|uniref:Sugar diacid utilization regulator n=1 Tax=Bacillus benzoevorans TaxID=1456 RepID=A0A7X0LW22_9BACI|nr:helix-turn-helix domain-containing protein [Bacillus benzoevorans]MBB6446621.1 sugar diacid utilization regulator [Bacillus benzoevorans]
MKRLYQDMLLSIPLYQLTFLTPLPQEKLYYETVSTTIPDHWFESSTLLVLDSDEECSKLNNIKYVNQLIQDSNLVAIIICQEQNFLFDDHCLSLLSDCKVPVVRTEEVLSLPVLQTNRHPHSFSMLSLELNGFMNKGFMDVATNLSIALDAPFLFIDENHQLLWQIGSQKEIEKALQWLKTNAKDSGGVNQARFILSEQNLAGKTVEPYDLYLINIAGQVQLSLVTYSNFSEWQRLMMDKFIGLTALFFQTDEMIRGQQEKMKEHFIYDLLYHKFESKKVLVKQGKSWGWDLDKPHHLFIIDVTIPEELMLHLEWMDEMMSHIETQFSQTDGIILFPFQDQLVVLLEDDESHNPSKRKNFVFAKAVLMEQELSRLWSDCQFHIGIGKWYQDSVNLNKSYQEAKMALQFGQVWFENHHVFHINDLGIIYLIIHLHKEILSDFCQEYLASLMESDVKNGTEYLKTLKAYFQFEGITNEVSDALYIHPNTLRNRLKKIEEITGVNLQNTTEYLNLMVAVKIHYSLFLS